VSVLWKMNGYSRHVVLRDCNSEGVHGHKQMGTGVCQRKQMAHAQTNEGACGHVETTAGAEQANKGAGSHGQMRWAWPQMDEGKGGHG
jgi:hypothetical protein